MNDHRPHPAPPPPTLPPGELAALLRVSLREEWRRGRHARAEEYLDRFPALRDHSVYALDLVYAEFLLREELGEAPDPDEYVRRFPQFADDFRRQLSVHRAAGPAESADDERTTLRAPRGPSVAGYEILGRLGRGGMGDVYKARQTSLKRVVALKTIRDGAAGIDLRARFLAEAEAVARLEHPNIVRIYDVGRQGELCYLALEYVAGGTLADRLRDGPLPPHDAVRLAEVVARAAHYAHQRGVVHRDLKPANVLLASGGCEPPGEEPPGGLRPPLAGYVPKITDFGLAKRLDADQGQTTTGAVLGTPAYMAPEQAMGRARDVGPSADVYALGAILYEMLTGRPPFRGETALATLEQVRSRPAEPPSRLRPGLPAGLDAVCLRCLAKDPAGRYPTALSLAEDLGRVLAGEAPAARPARRRRRLTALVVCVLLPAVLLAVVALPARERARSDAAPAPPPTPLQGGVDVRVWKAGATNLPGLRLHQAGALPLKAGDCMRIDARLNRPAYLYVIQLLASGEVVPLYPWGDGRWDARPADEAPRASLALPDEQSRAAELDPGPAGVESVLLLAREEKLPAGDDAGLAALFAGLPAPPRPTDLSLAAWFENGEPVTSDKERGQIRLDREREVGGVVLRTQALLRGRLRPRFSYTWAVCYGFEGE